jgi:hypothetical protein
MFQRLKRLGVDRWVAVANVAVGATIALAALAALPIRSPSLAVPLFAVLALLTASAIGLAARARWADRVTRVAAIVLLLAGLLVLAGLMLELAFHRGLTGPAGGPGPLSFALTLLLVLPYTVIYPAGLLLWLDSRGPSR